MRFAFAHKLTTYMMVFCAFFAVGLSGEISPILVGVALIASLGSWLWETPRIDFQRFSLPWTILSLLVLAYALLSAFIGGDFLIIGAEFLLYLLVAKLFNRRACKDYLHIYVITFLMLVAGTVLNSEFTYGIFFLGYVVSATWALILFHLRREMEDNFLLKHSDDRPSERVEVTRILNSRRIVGKRFFIGTSLVSLTIFVVASLLFLMIPRIGIGYFFQKNRAGITMAGFSDGVKLGGHGTIKTDSTVVMRVEVDDEYQGRRAPYIYWRGVAFDLYKGGQWSRSRTAPPTIRQMTYPNAGKERHHLLYDKPSDQPRSYLAERLGETIEQRIYLEPIGSDVLFAASMPAAFEFDVRLGLRSPRTERNDEIRFSHTSGVRYSVYSSIDKPDPRLLRAAPRTLPRLYHHYLQIPEEITSEIRELAREITRDQPTDYDKAVAIESWLKSNLDYTLEMRSPGRTEPIHFFVFERQKGHCEYFSSAMTILLRAANIPARNVNGFLGGEWNEYNDYIAVRAGDAHSWVEVYFHGVGWVTFDPTPAAEVDQLGRGGISMGDRMRRLFDTMRFKWFKWVIEYDLYRQVSLFRDLREQVSGSASTVKKGLESFKSWFKRHSTVLLSVLGAAILGPALFFWLRRRRWKIGSGMIRRDRTRDPVSSLYNAVLDKLARRGHRRAPSVTPREHAAALVESAAPGASELARLTDLYYQVLYGTRSSDDVLPEARELGDAIDHALREARRNGAGKNLEGGQSRGDKSRSSA